MTDTASRIGDPYRAVHRRRARGRRRDLRRARPRRPGARGRPRGRGRPRTRRAAPSPRRRRRSRRGPRSGPHERAAQVRASLGALAADNDERVELLSRENGKVRSECDIEMHVLENRFELAAGPGRRGRRRARAARAAVPHAGLLPAARRGQPDRPVQLAAGDPRRVAAAGARGRQHGRRQGAADDAAVVRAHDRADRRRAAARRAQRRLRPRRRARPGADQDPRVRKVGFTGSVARREADHGDGRRQPHAGHCSSWAATTPRSCSTTPR